jgi:hypothetical protein
MEVEGGGTVLVLVLVPSLTVICDWNTYREFITVDRELRNVLLSCTALLVVGKLVVAILLLLLQVASS